MRFLPEDPHTHGAAPTTAVLLLNLGTPDEPSVPAVRRYLREFLWDARVVEIPRLLWWLILNLFILPFRPKDSAARYASVWTSEGSPLLAVSRRQQNALRAALQVRGLAIEVGLAMRYGNPSVADEWHRLKGLRAKRLILLPMYPQYSATTTASTFDAVAQVAARTRNLPEMRFVRGFHDHPGYIEALRRRVEAHWAEHGRPDKLIISFHGLPRRNLDLGDPYFCESHKTGRLLAQALALSPDQFEVCFQSRFGRAQWLQPYTARRVRELAQSGVRRLDVVCPGFVADCLETLEEIAQEARLDFLAHGGESLRAIACLNDDPAFIQVLADIVEAQAAGWPVSVGEAMTPAQGDDILRRARALGAAR